MTELVALEKIGGGKTLVEQKGQPDRNDRLETAAAKKAEAEAQSVVEGNRDKRSLRVLRFRYAKNVFVFMVFYCLGALILVLLQGFKFYEFNVGDTTLAIIVGSTAASVVGLVGFVVSGLFSSK